MKPDRVIIFIIFVAVGALAYGWWFNNQRIVATQQEQIQRFMDKGSRFTAQDGKQLCERIMELEKRSYGYRDAGKTPLPCDYTNRK